MAIGFDRVIEDLQSSVQAMLDILVENDLIDADEFESVRARHIQRTDQEHAEIEEVLASSYDNGPVEGALNALRKLKPEELRDVLKQLKKER